MRRLLIALKVAVLLPVVLLTTVAPAFAAPASTLNGMVFHEKSGKGIAAAAIIISPLQHTLFSAADGSFYFVGIPAGTYRISVSTSSFSSRNGVTVTLSPGHETYLKIAVTEDNQLHAATVESLLPAARLRGRVLQESQRDGVGGATVSISGGAISALTDSSGWYELPNLAAGTYSVSATVEGCPLTVINNVLVTAGAEQRLDIVAGLASAPRRKRTTVESDRFGGTITGVLKGRDMRPIGAARVWIPGTAYETYTEVHGFFRMADIDAACYPVQIAVPGRAAVTLSSVPVIPLQVTNLDIVVTSAETHTLTQSIFAWKPAELHATVLDARTARAVASACLEIESIYQPFCADSSGVIVAADLNPYAYDISISADGYGPLHIQRYAVYEGSQVRDTFRLSVVTADSVSPDSSRIVGTIVARDGAPVYGAAVSLQFTGVSTVSDSSGTFDLGSVQPGHYAVLLSSPGYRSDTLSIETVRGTVAHVAATLSPTVFRRAVALETEAAGALDIRVVDSRNKPVGGATVVLSSTDATLVSDPRGTVRFARLLPGDYSLSALSDGLIAVPVAVTVVADTLRTATISLKTDDITDLGRVAVVGAAIKTSDAALLRDRKESFSVSDGVSAAEFSRAGAGNVADAMKQVPGVTIIDGKYIAIRGLSDRYVNTTLNGMLLPSPDPDKRAVPLDMFPTALLDNIVTNKSFTPDKPGDFAGGNVDIRTSTIPDKFTFSVSLSGALDSAVFADKSFLTYAGGKTDWLGIDDGTRAIPVIVDQTETFPNHMAARTISEQSRLLDSLTKSFNGGYVPDEISKHPDWGFGLTVSNRFNLFRRPLGVLLSLTYSNKSAAYQNGTNARYEYQQIASAGDYNELGVRRSFTEDRSTRDILWGGLAALSFEPAQHHKLGFNYMYVHNAEDDVRHAQGFLPNTEAGRIAEYYSIQYSERALSTYQLFGAHRLPLRLSLDWRVSQAKTEQDQPDLRIMMFHRNIVLDPDDGYDYSAHENILPVKNPERIFRVLREKSYQFGGDLKFRPLGHENDQLFFQLGAQLFGKSREYRVRRFSYEPNRGGSTTLNDAGGPEGYFDESNLGIVDTRLRASDTTFIFGLFITELNVESVNYDASRKSPAVYVLGSLDPISWLNISGGVRYENAALYLRNFADTEIDSEFRNWLPSAAAKVSLPNNMQLRFSYGKTLARPTEKELEPPPGSFDPSENSPSEGNPNLIPTTIHNTDIRWEWYQNARDLFSLSLFYKNLLEPIEKTVINNNGTISYRNVEQATILGLELEARYSFERISSVLAPLSVGGNLALISSKLTIDTSEYRLRKEYDASTEPTRQLQGQSPWVVNAYLVYSSKKLGLNASATFNILGPTITTVSAGDAPDVYSEPHPSLGVSLGKKIGKGFAVETSVRNMFGDSKRAVSTFAGTEYVNVDQHRGRSYGLKVSYKF